MKSKFKSLVEELSPETRRFVRKQGDIAARISGLLKEKNLKQADLAKMLDMKKSQVSKILAGNANLTLKTISRIETVLGDDVIRVPFISEVFDFTFVEKLSSATQEEFSRNIGSHKIPAKYQEFETMVVNSLAQTQYSYGEA